MIWADFCQAIGIPLPYGENRSLLPLPILA